MKFLLGMLGCVILFSACGESPASRGVIVLPVEQWECQEIVVESGTRPILIGKVFTQMPYSEDVCVLWRRRD